MEESETLERPQLVRRHQTLVKVAALHESDVSTSTPLVTRFDSAYLVPDLSNDVSLPFYPTHLNERFLPYDSQLDYLKLTEDFSGNKVKETPLETRKMLVHFIDPWPQLFREILEEKIFDSSWCVIMPPHVVHSSVEQCTALYILEIKALHRQGLLSDSINHFLKFYKQLSAFDFYNEKELERFKNMGGGYLLKDILQLEHIQVQIACLDILRRFTMNTEYAAYMHEIFPQIVQYLIRTTITLTGDAEERHQSILAVMLLKNLARCDSVKKEFEEEKHLIEILVSFNTSMNRLHQTLLPQDVRVLEHYYCGLMTQILSDASETESCKMKISRQNITSRVKMFLESPLFQNDVIFFYKNMSTLESDRIEILKQNILSNIGHLLRHYLKTKHVYPCIELVRNLLRSKKFEDFVTHEEIIRIVKSLIAQINKLELYKYNEDLTNVLLQIIQSCIHKYIQDPSSVQWLQDLNVVESVLESLKYEIFKLCNDCFCTPEKANEAKYRVDVRIDILSHSVDYEEMRSQFSSLEPVLELVRLQTKKIIMYPKTFRKVLRLIRKLGNEWRFRRDYYKELPRFWAIFKNQCHEKIRFEAALIISEICSSWKIRCPHEFGIGDLVHFFGKDYKPPSHKDLNANFHKGCEIHSADELENGSKSLPFVTETNVVNFMLEENDKEVNGGIGSKLSISKSIDYPRSNNEMYTPIAGMSSNYEYILSDDDMYEREESKSDEVVGDYTDCVKAAGKRIEDILQDLNKKEDDVEDTEEASRKDEPSVPFKDSVKKYRGNRDIFDKSHICRHKDFSAFCPCINCVVIQLRPLMKAKNQTILEGACSIINVILNMDTIEKHFKEQHERHMEDDENESLCYIKTDLCSVCQLIVWNVNILKRLNIRKQVKVRLLQRLMTFFLTISTNSEIVKFLSDNDILTFLIPFIKHEDGAVKTKLVEIINQLSKHEEFISSCSLKKKKLQLFRELTKIYNDNDEIKDIMRQFTWKMMKVKPLISYEREVIGAVPAVTMKIFKINRWVR